jgi:hypothetical protein
VGWWVGGCVCWCVGAWVRGCVGGWVGLLPHEGGGEGALRLPEQSQPPCCSALPMRAEAMAAEAMRAEARAACVAHPSPSPTWGAWPSTQCTQAPPLCPPGIRGPGSPPARSRTPCRRWCLWAEQGGVRWRGMAGLTGWWPSGHLQCSTHCAPAHSRVRASAAQGGGGGGCGAVCVEQPRARTYAPAVPVGGQAELAGADLVVVVAHAALLDLRRRRRRQRRRRRRSAGAGVACVVCAAPPRQAKRQRPTVPAGARVAPRPCPPAPRSKPTTATDRPPPSPLAERPTRMSGSWPSL